MQQPAAASPRIDLNALHQLLEAGVRALPFAQQAPARLYQPLAYILGLPGKRLRPTLVLLGYGAYCDRPPSSCLQTALAVELFHNFTLLHDDIMDNAPTRRGQPTVHERWDVNTAILSGDALFAYTHGQIAAEFPEVAAPLLQLYTRIALEVCEGQMEDMELAARPHASVGEYVAMIEKKTAALLGGALRMGALAAGAPPEAQAQLEAFGRAAGIGFQLQDDYLDAFADPAKFGKKVGGDIVENKKTYLWLLAYERASATQQAELDRWATYQGPEHEKIAGVLALYHALGVDAATRDFTQAWFQEAEARLEPLVANPRVADIRAFMDRLRVREF